MPILVFMVFLHKKGDIMNSNWGIVIVIVAFLLFVFGIIALANPQPPAIASQYQEVNTQELGNMVRRIFDEEAGVYCWLLYDMSISCLPCQDTALGCQE